MSNGAVVVVLCALSRYGRPFAGLLSSPLTVR
jgi:hypothetical protein